LALKTATAREAFDGWQQRPPLPLTARPLGRVEIDGKQFKADGVRFPFRGVTYGTFAERPDGALFPESTRLRADL